MVNNWKNCFHIFNLLPSQKSEIHTTFAFSPEGKSPDHGYSPVAMRHDHIYGGTTTADLPLSLSPLPKEDPSFLGSILSLEECNRYLEGYHLTNPTWDENWHVFNVSIDDCVEEEFSCSFSSEWHLPMEYFYRISKRFPNAILQLLSIENRYDCCSIILVKNGAIVQTVLGKNHLMRKWLEEHYPCLFTQLQQDPGKNNMELNIELDEFLAKYESDAIEWMLGPVINYLSSKLVEYDFPVNTFTLEIGSQSVVLQARKWVPSTSFALKINEGSCHSKEISTC
jgi:hypothetical protein